MKGYRMKLWGVLLLPLAAGLLFVFSPVKEAQGKGLIVVKGLLTSEQCLKKPVCYLEWYREWIKNPSSDPLVLFTATRTAYRLEAKGVPNWKFGLGFGKQVAIRGVQDGRRIIVYDLIPLSGRGKLSKACL